MRTSADRPLNVQPATVRDYRELARRRLPRQLFDYADGGAYEEATMRANETDLEGRQIGPIRITDLYAVVGVPEDRADGVIDALRNTMIRGRTPTVRRYVDNGGERPAKQGHRGQRRTSYGDRDDRGPRSDRPAWGDRPTRGGDRPSRGGDRPNRGKGGKW